MVGTGRRWVDGAAFGWLCFLASSRWMVADTWPAMGSTLRSQAWACGLLAGGWAVVCVVRQGLRFPRRSALTGIATGAGLLALPAVGAALRGAASEPFNRTVALCFVPLVVAVAGGTADGGPRPSWWPGLAGLGGALLVFPLTLPNGTLGYAGLFLPVLGVAAACVVVGRLALTAWTAVWLLAGGSAGLVSIEVLRRLAGGGQGQPSSEWAVLLDAGVAGLSVFVVLRSGGQRYVARYFAVPLLTIAEGLAVGISGVTFRLAVGMVLLAGAALSLWRTRATDEPLSLRLT